jgi:hypothetical protein
VSRWPSCPTEGARASRRSHRSQARQVVPDRPTARLIHPSEATCPPERRILRVILEGTVPSFRRERETDFFKRKRKRKTSMSSLPLFRHCPRF